MKPRSLMPHRFIVSAVHAHSASCPHKALRHSVTESVTVPLQRLLGLLSIFFPRSDSDILSSSWQSVGFIQVLNVEAWRFTPAHLLRGIIVAIETEIVVLPHHRLSTRNSICYRQTICVFRRLRSSSTSLSCRGSQYIYAHRRGNRSFGR